MQPRPNKLAPERVFVSVAGNIGSGKSSLTTVLSQHFQWKAFFEIVETNPYLQDFYADMPRWSFQTQIFFLTKRFRHLQEILASSETVIQDRSIYEDAEVFAKNLFLQGLMSERDYRTYTEHFQTLDELLQPPDLLIYLKSDVPTLKDRISSRNRPYEQSLGSDYLERLNECYESWIERFTRCPVVTVDVSKLDFLNSAQDLRKMIAIVNWELECHLKSHQGVLPLMGALGRPPLSAASRNSELTKSLL